MTATGEDLNGLEYFVGHGRARSAQVLDHLVELILLFGEQQGVYAALEELRREAVRPKKLQSQVREMPAGKSHAKISKFKFRRKNCCCEKRLEPKFQNCVRS